MGSKLPTLVQGLEAAVAAGRPFYSRIRAHCRGKTTLLLCAVRFSCFLSTAAGWKVHSWLRRRGKTQRYRERERERETSDKRGFGLVSRFLSGLEGSQYWGCGLVGIWRFLPVTHSTHLVEASCTLVRALLSPTFLGSHHSLEYFSSISLLMLFLNRNQQSQLSASCPRAI